LGTLISPVLNADQPGAEWRIAGIEYIRIMPETDPAGRIETDAGPAAAWHSQQHHRGRRTDNPALPSVQQHTSPPDA
jgi:hypothetical protein